MIPSLSVKTTESIFVRAGSTHGKLVKFLAICHILTEIPAGGSSPAWFTLPQFLFDRNNTPPLLASIRWAFPWLRHVNRRWRLRTDRNFGNEMEKIGQWTLEFVKSKRRRDGLQCIVLRRWVVDPTCCLSSVATVPSRF